MQIPPNSFALRLLLGSLGAIFLLKIAGLALRRGPKTATGLALFLFAWPGVIPDSFRQRRASEAIEPGAFLAAWARMVLGVVSIVLLAVYAPRIPDQVLGLAGISAFLLTIHLGICGVLPWMLRWAGFGVPLLFDRPWAVASVSFGVGDGTWHSSK